ncbi:MAG: hypothetical protein U1F98_10855 [Verrucomicrobiota bacterium]
MRALFITITFVGALLSALSVFEISAVRSYRVQLSDIQAGLAEWERIEQAEASRHHMVITGESIAYRFGLSIGGIDRIENGWWAVASAGGALLLVGAWGAIAARRPCHKSAA